MERNRNYDLLRVVGMLFVIYYHGHEKPFGGTPLLFHALMVLLAAGNGLFFMMSGRFNLQHRFTGPADYREFYAKKAITILFPYVVMSLVFTLWTSLTGQTAEPLRLGNYLRNAFLDLCYRNAATHLWFMYVLIGILVITPFLAKLFQSLKDYELKLFIGLCLCWNMVSTFLVQDGLVYRLLGGDPGAIQPGFAYDAFILSDWIDAFLFGYFAYRLIRKEMLSRIVAVGMVGFLTEVLGKTFLNDSYKNWDNFAPAYLVFFPMVYSLFVYGWKIRDNAFGKVIGFLAKHSYMIYLVHWYVNISIFEHRLIDTGIIGLNFILIGAATFAVSLGISIVLNELLFFPVEGRLTKWLRQQAEQWRKETDEKEKIS